MKKHRMLNLIVIVLLIVIFPTGKVVASIDDEAIAIDSLANCEPTIDQVALYVDRDYTGQCVILNVGDYLTPEAFGLPNDSITAIKVGSNVKATLCQHINYNAPCEIFITNDPGLGDNTVGNDQVSSVKVDCNPKADQVALYVDINFAGSCVVKPIGEYPTPATMGILNDSISSVIVAHNIWLTLCQHDNYGGRCDIFITNDANLGDNSIGNDQASSARVSRVFRIYLPLLGVSR